MGSQWAGIYPRFTRPLASQFTLVHDIAMLRLFPLFTVLSMQSLHLSTPGRDDSAAMISRF